MISFNNLGWKGYLGNQMFQYASLRGIASHKKYWYSIPHREYELNQCFKLPPTLDRQFDYTVFEENYEFNQDLFNNCSDDVNIDGFFQTEKYFKHIEDEIRKDFEFKDEIYDISYECMKRNFSGSEVIAVHIRRGDYLTDDSFECLPLDYYKNALQLMPDVPVLILSDDPEWCRENFKSERFFTSFSKNQYIDLCLMSLCDYHIIANSTFSWWGSWLAKSKKTIAPKMWFSPTGKLKSWNTKDVYRPEWILL